VDRDLSKQTPRKASDSETGDRHHRPMRAP
jgi:hypothetical protein